MAKPFSTVTIIYNPQSTGPGERVARRLQSKLLTLVPKQKVNIVATESAGHAEQLAYELAKSSKRPLIISASGDGGYGEVINGVLRANHDGAHAVTGLLAAGNANDHYHNLHKHDIAEAIVSGKTRLIDILQFRARCGGKPFLRYAHSYIGLGMTPQVGQALNRARLNAFNEIFIVARVLLFLRPVHLVIQQEEHGYDSVLVSNIPKMSKYLTIASQARVDDGQFELTIFRRRYKFQLIHYLITASTKGLSDAKSLRKFVFKTTHATKVQLDGEIFQLDADCTVNISIKPTYLECIV